MYSLFAVLPDGLFWIPQLVGVLAVATFLLSYQQKTRRGIITLNVISRVLYITQYLLLGAFSGAALDILGAVSSVIAARKQSGFVSRYKYVILIAMDVAMVAVGLLLWESIYSLFAILGILLHTTAFWIDDERVIRRISLLGSPFWFVYNFASRAYGSAVGDVLTMASIVIAMIRYRKSKADEG